MVIDVYVVTQPYQWLYRSSSSSIFSSLVLSDTKVYEPYIRALLGTASQFCGVVVLKLMEEAKDAWDQVRGMIVYTSLYKWLYRCLRGYVVV